MGWGNDSRPRVSCHLLKGVPPSPTCRVCLQPPGHTELQGRRDGGTRGSQRVATTLPPKTVKRQPRSCSAGGLRNGHIGLLNYLTGALAGILLGLSKGTVKGASPRRTNTARSRLQPLGYSVSEHPTPFLPRHKRRSGAPSSVCGPLCRALPLCSAARLPRAGWWQFWPRQKALQAAQHRAQSPAQRLFAKQTGGVGQTRVVFKPPPLPPLSRVQAEI